MERLKLGGRETSAVALSSLAGIVVFPATLSGLQRFFFKPLRLTCSTPAPFLSSLLGAGAVLPASAAASLSVVSLAAFLSPRRERQLNRAEILFSTVTGVAVFKALGGRFRSVLPSHLLRPGAFAALPVPAKGQRFANAHQREAVNLIGRRHGCHSCGRRGQSFIADHQPPNKLAVPGVLQSFFAHCRSCSSRQGAVLRRSGVNYMKSPNAVVTHGSSLRLYHVFLPIPLFVPFLREVLSWGREGDMSSSSTGAAVSEPSVVVSGSRDSLSSQQRQQQCAGTQTDASGTTTDMGVETGGVLEGDDPYDMLSVEAVQQRVLQVVRGYLGLFPGDVGQVYAMVHVCILLAALSNLVG